MNDPIIVLNIFAVIFLLGGARQYFKSSIKAALILASIGFISLLSSWVIYISSKDPATPPISLTETDDDWIIYFVLFLFFFSGCILPKWKNIKKKNPTP